jgi:hypothetical protein
MDNYKNLIDPKYGSEGGLATCVVEGLLVKDTFVEMCFCINKNRNNWPVVSLLYSAEITVDDKMIATLPTNDGGWCHHTQDQVAHAHRTAS